MRNPQPLVKSKLPAAPRFKSEPLFVSTADPRLVSNARNELENLAKKPARSSEEKLVNSSFNHEPVFEKISFRFIPKFYFSILDFKFSMLVTSSIDLSMQKQLTSAERQAQKGLAKTCALRRSA